MKRLLLWVAILALCCTACGGEQETTANALPVESTTASPLTSTTITTDSVALPTTPPTSVDVSDDPYEKVMFELPLNGATGFASVDTPFYRDGEYTAVIRILLPGDAFTVLGQTAADTWHVRTEDGAVGYVENTCCYLNIADVIPSVVLDNTNSYSSAFLSSGKEVPSITGQQLYNAKVYNPRLGREEFMVACNWRMVQKIYAAQQAAMAAGYTLMINEAFRPNDVQQQVATALKALYDTDPEVKAGIDTAPWNISWFIASRPSTHQMGCAIDASLARVNNTAIRRCGDYAYQVVTDYTLCEMPTPIHELSAAAASLSKPVNSYSLTAWQSIAPAASMTEDALKLKEFCTGAGLSPLASEWWHFNDLGTKTLIGERFTTDPFYLDTCVSAIP